MPSKRTGLMPSKKNFTAVGGVGARPFSLQNKISREAPRVAGTATNVVAAAVLPPAALPPAALPPAVPPVLPPPTPVTEPRPTLDILFDTRSFLNTFDGKHPGYPDEQLETKYWTALVNATTRWENFLSYHPDYHSIVNEKYKATFDKDWNGIELVGIRYGTDDPNHIATAAAVSFSGTNLTFGFVLEINVDIMKNGFKDPKSGAVSMLSSTNIINVFAHELGHVLGLCASITRGDVVRIPSNFSGVDWLLNHLTYYDRVGGNLLDRTAGRAMSGGRFPQTYAVHNKLIQSATEKLLAGPKYIMLSDDESHWNDGPVSFEVYAWTTPDQRYKKIGMQHYGNFENEIMVSGYNPVYDNKNGYLISSKSLKYLIEMRRGDDLQMFNEKSPGASEVSSVIKTGNAPNITYILKGKAGSVFPAIKGIATVERTLPRDANATDTHDDAYNVFYPDGYAGDCEDAEEIIQIVKNHERIVNDPAFFKFKCNH